MHNIISNSFLTSQTQKNLSSSIYQLSKTYLKTLTSHTILPRNVTNNKTVLQSLEEILLQLENYRNSLSTIQVNDEEQLLLLSNKIEKLIQDMNNTLINWVNEAKNNKKIKKEKEKITKKTKPSDKKNQIFLIFRKLNLLFEKFQCSQRKRSFLDCNQQMKINPILKRKKQNQQQEQTFNKHNRIQEMKFTKQETLGFQGDRLNSSGSTNLNKSDHSVSIESDRLKDTAICLTDCVWDESQSKVISLINSGVNLPINWQALQRIMYYLETRKMIHSNQVLQITVDTMRKNNYEGYSDRLKNINDFHCQIEIQLLKLLPLILYRKSGIGVFFRLDSLDLPNLFPSLVFLEDVLNLNEFETILSDPIIKLFVKPDLKNKKKKKLNITIENRFGDIRNTLRMDHNLIESESKYLKNLKIQRLKNWDSASSLIKGFIKRIKNKSIQTVEKNIRTILNLDSSSIKKNTGGIGEEGDEKDNNDESKEDYDDNDDNNNNYDDDNDNNDDDDDNDDEQNKKILDFLNPKKENTQLLNGKNDNINENNDNYNQKNEIRYLKKKKKLGKKLYQFGNIDRFWTFTRIKYLTEISKLYPQFCSIYEIGIFNKTLQYTKQLIIKDYYNLINIFNKNEFAYSKKNIYLAGYLKYSLKKPSSSSFVSNSNSKSNTNTNTHTNNSNNNNNNPISDYSISNTSSLSTLTQLLINSQNLHINNPDSFIPKKGKIKLIFNNKKILNIQDHINNLYQIFKTKKAIKPFVTVVCPVGDIEIDPMSLISFIYFGRLWRDIGFQIFNIVTFAPGQTNSTSISNFFLQIEKFFTKKSTLLNNNKQKKKRDKNKKRKNAFSKLNEENVDDNKNFKEFIIQDFKGILNRNIIKTNFNNFSLEYFFDNFNNLKKSNILNNDFSFGIDKEMEIMLETETGRGGGTGKGKEKEKENEDVNETIGGQGREEHIGKYNDYNVIIKFILSKKLQIVNDPKLSKIKEEIKFLLKHCAKTPYMITFDRCKDPKCKHCVDVGKKSNVNSNFDFNNFCSLLNKQIFQPLPSNNSPLYFSSFEELLGRIEKNEISEDIKNSYQYLPSKSKWLKCKEKTCNWVFTSKKESIHHYNLFHQKISKNLPNPNNIISSNSFSSFSITPLNNSNTDFNNTTRSNSNNNINNDFAKRGINNLKKKTQKQKKNTQKKQSKIINKSSTKFICKYITNKKTGQMCGLQFTSSWQLRKHKMEEGHALPRGRPKK
ncbi:morphogenesis protein sog2 [Anaeramoeba flamelloides]|uniref:Morphogenesis protein sog2 n=1 Tax=Anaeramoeba flamelloides TaxID=1746091 RepID=A0AAV8AK92_9EUKA|nr:morphogenesis protein sog2 [Anaeramoeba flamelloides]